ncbi:hypothetical protein JXC34_03820 [Candidatus Woesearchaeota archaeon]|nr:hypothetical protein [Candidatus Woesearchaeota archaeon]
MAQGSPINDILQMRQQGLSNNQIIQNLQRHGYSNTQIFDAMNQADTKMAVEGGPNFQQFSSPNQDSPELFTQPPLNNDSGMTGHSMQSDQPHPSSGGESFQTDQVKIEELVEAIIEEKWVELAKDVNRIVEWKNKIENKITEIEINLNNLKDSFSDLNKAVLSKINDYDKHILEVGSDVKAMEKVFSKVLPVFTENVNELSRIANKIKQKEGGG